MCLSGLDARSESCRCATTVGRRDLSTSTGDLLCPLYVDSGRPVSAKLQTFGTPFRSDQIGLSELGRNDASQLGDLPSTAMALSIDAEGTLSASMRFGPELAVNSFGDREVKALNIGLHIGRRPLLAFGNSDGDLAMMRYTKSGSGPRLAVLLHHDDATREAAYDREFRLAHCPRGSTKLGSTALRS
jgi:hypothetical protein